MGPAGRERRSCIEPRRTAVDNPHRILRAPVPLVLFAQRGHLESWVGSFAPPFTVCVVKQKKRNQTNRISLAMTVARVLLPKPLNRFNLFKWPRRECYADL